jgi:hypothetical protein
MSIIIPANSAVGGGFNIDNALRFNSGSSDYLHFTPSSDGNRRTMTLSVWIKGSALANGSSDNILGQYNSSNENNSMLLLVETAGKIMVWNYPTSAYTMDLRTNRLLKDPSAWYHIVVAVDTTQGTDSNRVKIYVNGVQETSFATATYPSQNLELFMNQNKAQNIGTQRYGSTVGSPFNGYMAEFAFIDGTQYAASDFGEFDEDSGIWKPIDISGLTFGTNGYYLDFKDSSALGNDVSGNDNDFTVVNLTAIDQSTDTCTNNFATLNRLNSTLTNTVLSEGNLKLVGGRQSANYTYITGTIAASSGKWYWEVKAVDNSEIDQVGVAKMDLAQFANIDSSGGLQATTYGGKGVQMSNGNKVGDGAQSAYMGGFSANDICMVALDLDNNKITFGRNGSWSNGSGGADQAFADATAAYTNLTTGTMYVPAQCMRDSGASNPGTMEYNFGNAPYTISSGNTDGNGYGNFEYAVPSGYYALNTKNLAEYG